MLSVLLFPSSCFCSESLIYVSAKTLLLLRQPPGSLPTMSGNTNNMQILLIIHCLFLFPSSYSLIAKSVSSFSWIRSGLKGAVKPGSGQSGPLSESKQFFYHFVFSAAGGLCSDVIQQVNKCFPAPISSA